MEANNISGDYAKLEELYIAQVINMTEAMGNTAILWQEVFDNGLQLSNNTIIHVWKPGHEAELAQVNISNVYNLRVEYIKVVACTLSYMILHIKKSQVQKSHYNIYR
jgi:hypothetical protein